MPSGAVKRKKFKKKIHIAYENMESKMYLNTPTSPFLGFWLSRCRLLSCNWYLIHFYKEVPFSSKHGQRSSLLHPSSYPVDFTVSLPLCMWGFKFISLFQHRRARLWPPGMFFKHQIGWKQKGETDHQSLQFKPMVQFYLEKLSAHWRKNKHF